MMRRRVEREQTGRPAAVACIKCGQAAQNPVLPLCLTCDLARLHSGQTADDIKREAAELRAREPK